MATASLCKHALKAGKDTHRPLRMQEDVSQFQDQGVWGLVVGLLQGVREQLGTGGLYDHLQETAHRSGIIRKEAGPSGAAGREPET